MILMAILLQAQAQIVCTPQPFGRVVCERRQQMDYQAVMDRAAASVRAQEPDLGKRVSRLVLNGDCDGARRMALRGGDMDMAAKVGEVCK